MAIDLEDTETIYQRSGRATDRSSSEYRQTISPSYQKGSFAVNDTNNHRFRFDARGKGRLTYHVINASDKEVLATVYGAPDDSAVIGDADVVAVDGATLTVAATSQDYEVINDPFPYYIIDITPQAGSGDGNLCTLNVYLSAM